MHSGNTASGERSEEAVCVQRLLVRFFEDFIMRRKEEKRSSIQCRKSAGTFHIHHLIPGTSENPDEGVKVDD